jgi:very-short-patch-repair endonuclease
MLPRDYTVQENLIAERLSTYGLRYDQQYDFYPYTVDFWISELNLIIEADGVHGHLQKRDKQRDFDLMGHPSVEWILHIIGTTKQDIEEELWRGLNSLEENVETSIAKING